VYFVSEAAVLGHNTCSQALDRILQQSKKGRTRSSNQYHASGGMSQADRDFNEIVGTAPVKDHGSGIRSSTLADGSTSSVRPNSTQGSPTIQVNPPKGKPIKIRY
jgi:hypothetical protein